VRALKVTFRAVFENPIGLLNPMGLKIPGPQPVEIFGQGERWQVREIASPRRQVFTKLGRFISAEHAKREVADHFAQQIQAWQIWGTVPGDGEKSLAVERMLTPYDVVSLDGGKWAALDAEDRTHILHGPLIRPDSKVPNAACGAQVNAKAFINNRANIEPSCRGCAEVWRKEYQNK
jgi:hypothetical protein